MLKCPNCGLTRSSAADTLCSGCGLVFAKWARRILGEGTGRRRGSEAGDSTTSDWLALLLPASERTDAITFYGRCALLLAFTIWGLYFVSLDLDTNEIGASFLHRVNLVFHEAGHVLFMPFGHFMMVLGGTLGQLLIPAICGTVLLVKNRDAFGASIALWWLGQSVMDCAPYINDARDLQLMLLGGGTGADRPGAHDWENILLDLGLIHREREIAWAADRLGELLLLTALAWGAAVLYRQYLGLQRGSASG